LNAGFLLVEELYFFSNLLCFNIQAQQSSEGRVISGLGIGWSKDEYLVSGIPFKDRGKRADEYVQLLKKIWINDVVEFKGKYYNIPASKIGPKPIQKPHIPIYLGGFSPNTYSRIVNYDANGWLGVIGGPIEYLENTMNTIKDMASKANKDPNNFEAILLTYPNIVDSKVEDATRYPLTGTIDEIGSEIQRIKQIAGINHIIFAYNFVSIGRDVSNMIDKSKELSKFAR
jgi:alkanesulfonate monooxygenase SsuD/methylene tetrahydromethanopterin reductase-like flavin-dependent oxidoreductase (luciferase family)